MFEYNTTGFLGDAFLRLDIENPAAPHARDLHAMRLSDLVPELLVDVFAPPHILSVELYNDVTLSEARLLSRRARDDLRNEHPPLDVREWPPSLLQLGDAGRIELVPRMRNGKCVCGVSRTELEGREGWDCGRATVRVCASLCATHQHLPDQCVPSLLDAIVNQSWSEALFSWTYLINAAYS